MPVFFEWLKDGNQLLASTSPQPQVKIDYQEETSFLLVKGITIQDSGEYTCIVKNVYGTDSTTTQLIVKGLSLILILFFFCFINL